MYFENQSIFPSNGGMTKNSEFTHYDEFATEEFEAPELPKSNLDKIAKK